MPDNGIKFLARGGHKLDDELEDAIETHRGEGWERPTGAEVGRVTSDPARAARHYVQHLVGTIDTDLSGLRIAMDCANGAASEVGPAALRAAGAEVLVINAAPDGRNINDRAGSTHPEQLQAFTAAAGADFGVAFDGDADRCLAVDGTGAIVDGDQIMGVLALALRERGALAHDTLVITVMSNLGLRLAMRAQGITTVDTAVGDRYVLEAMRAHGYVLGGEQSGHIILAEHATTGDGVLTAMQLAARVAATGRSLADLAAVVQRLPQTLVNVSGVDRARVSADDRLAQVIADVEAGLGGTGRVLLRPSGTEPVVRVMVEAATQDEADRAASTLAGAVRDRLAL
jgi:phosphoglucosamine mutase